MKQNDATCTGPNTTSMSTPLVRIVRGQPTDDELVALVTSLLTISSDQQGKQRQNQSAYSAWTDRAQLLHAYPYGLTPCAWQQALQQ